MIDLIVEEFIEIRLDKFLKRKFAYLTQGTIERCLRKKHIRLNGKRVKACHIITNGNVINIASYLAQTSLVVYPTYSFFSLSVISLAKKLMKKYVIFSCTQFLVINKPQGLATQGGSKITLSIDHALQYLNETYKKHYKLVHRLDKNTSGTLIIAQNFNSAALISKAFREKEIQKSYLAVVTGSTTFMPKKGLIKSHLEKDKNSKYNLIKENESGKFAETVYTILASKSNKNLIKYVPITGRMHQLRYHSKQIGLPILGDIKYGGLPFKRMMLHALQIKIPASVFGEEYAIKAPLDTNFKHYVDFFKISFLKS